MTQKTVGYVELEWTCKRCGTKNPGTTRACTNCGSPMAESDAFEAPAEGELITDAEKLAEAGAGPDIHCPFCGTRNPAGTAVCRQCGGDLKEAHKRQAGQVIGAFQQTEKAAEIKCAACGALNPASASRCQNCGASLTGERPPAAVPVKKAGGKTPAWIGIGVLALVGLVCVGLIAVILLSKRTTGLAAEVESVNWERRIQVLEQQPVEHGAWENNLPAAAERVQCEMRYRETRSDPAPSATEVCGTPYTLDQGSGIGKVVQDCNYQVYDSWCAYTLDEWQVVDTYRARGSGLNPAWPEVNFSSGQKEGERSEIYTVTFGAVSSGKQYVYEVDSLDEFLKFRAGSQWELMVNTFGNVTGVNPK